MADEDVKKNPENYLLLKQEELLVQEVKKISISEPQFHK